MPGARSTGYNLANGNPACSDHGAAGFLRVPGVGWRGMAGNGNRKGDSALVAALASGMTVKDAAESAGVGERTAHRRLEDATFRRAVGDARARMVENALGQLADASAEAVTTLRALLKADGETARLGAARSILELGTKLRESVEFEQRIARLEGERA
jgi:hypothetical protein